MWPKEPCVRWGQDPTSPFAAVRSDKSAMRPFIKYLLTMFDLCYTPVENDFR